MPPVTTHETLHEELFVPDTVHPLVHSYGIVVMDVSTGKYQAYNEPARDVLLVVNETGSKSAVHRLYAAKHPDTYPEDVANAVDVALQSVAACGVIASGQIRPPRKFPTVSNDGSREAAHASDVRMALPPNEGPGPALSLSERALGIRSLAQTVRLMRQPFSSWITKIEQLKSSALKPASFAEATHSKLAIASAAALWPGRAACLETAVATVLFGRARGVSIDLRFGAALDPIRFHAWVEAPDDGRPVMLPHEDQVTGQFYPIYTV